MVLFWIFLSMYCIFYFVTLLLVSFCDEKNSLQPQYRHTTFRMHSQLLTDYVIKFARWQHPAVGLGTRFGVLCTTSVSCRYQTDINYKIAKSIVHEIRIFLYFPGLNESLVMTTNMPGMFSFCNISIYLLCNWHRPTLIYRYHLWAPTCRGHSFLEKIFLNNRYNCPKYVNLYNVTKHPRSSAHVFLFQLSVTSITFG